MQTTIIRDFIIIWVSVFVTQIGGECKFELTARERLILRMHNELRRLHDGTADLCYGVSDGTHAFTSTEWSKRMLHEAYRDVSQVSHSKNPNTGENLFYLRSPDSVEGSYLDAINVWYSEVRHWKMNTEGGERGTFDNFAQIVRNSAREVQCGHKLSIRYGIFITCQYYPRWATGGPQIGALGLGMDIGVGKLYLQDETQSAQWDEVGVEISEDTPEKETQHEIYANEKVSKLANQAPSPESRRKQEAIIEAKAEVKANQLKIEGTENALNVTNTNQQQVISKETAGDRAKAPKTATVDEMIAAQNTKVTKNSTVANRTNKESEEENQAVSVDYQQNKQVNDGNNSKASVGHANTVSKPNNNTMQVKNIIVDGQTLSKEAVSAGEGKNSTEIIKSQDHVEKSNGTIAKGSEDNKTTAKDFSKEEEKLTTQHDKPAESKVNDSISGNSKTGEHSNTVKDNNTTKTEKYKSTDGKNMTLENGESFERENSQTKKSFWADLFGI